MTDPAITLEEAVQIFLAQVGAEERPSYQQELSRFLRWYGRSLPLARVTVPQVEAYAQEVQRPGGDHLARLLPLRGFLAYARERGYTSTNLATVIKVKKVAPRAPAQDVPAEKAVVHHMTAEGYQRLQEELAALKAQRPKLAQELRTAAADKDFRENAPYEAAREKQGKVEARIRDLEEALKSAAVLDGEKALGATVEPGHQVVLRDLASGEEVRFTLVGAKESDLARSRISVASPLGKALMGRQGGEEIEVSVPAGTLRYRILAIQ